jgi:hypothetical protein
MVVHNLIFEETTMRNSAQKIHCIGFWPDYDASFFASAYPTHHVNVVNPFELFKAPWLLKKWPRVLKECYFILHITQYIKQNRFMRVPCVDVEDSIKELYSVRHFLDCVLQD